MFDRDRSNYFRFTIVNINLRDLQQLYPKYQQLRSKQNLHKCTNLKRNRSV